MALNTDIAVIGGGPAGTAAAITLARAGRKVLLLEQGGFPRHKVCGEFVSSEALPLLEKLLPESRLVAAAPRIHNARLFAGTRVRDLSLPAPAAAITRHDLDAALWRAAADAGTDCRERSTVAAVRGDDGEFTLSLANGAEVFAEHVIDASGRWSRLRRVEAAPSNWIGVKGHFVADDEGSSCDLYFFRGGYCGVLPIGGGMVNAAAMVRADRARSIADVLQLHRALAQRSRNWKLAGEPLAVAPLVFRKPEPVRDGMLCVGDAAGFIDPFVGSGISLALHSGCAAAQAILRSETAAQAAPQYADWYRKAVGGPFASSAQLRRLALQPLLRDIALRLLPTTLLERYVVPSTRPAASLA